MASDRENAKRSIQQRDAEDAELDAVLSEGTDLKLKLLQETHRHKEHMLDKELGHIGRFIGGREAAPFNIAVSLLACGVIVVVGSLFAAAGGNAADKAFWGEQAQRGFALASGAAVFIAGRARR